MICSRCEDYQLHNNSPAAGRECRWTGCQVVAERKTEKWPCPLKLDVICRDAREAVASILGLADSRGLLDELIARYEPGPGRALRAHLDAARLPFMSMEATDGREEGAGCRTLRELTGNGA